MKDSKHLEVSIIGGGFSGLNSALILGKKAVKCEIYTTGYGASNLWMGTFDFLNYKYNNIKRSFQAFKDEHSNHPYSFFTYGEIKNALESFFREFPELTYFTNNEEFVNKEVLTSIGTSKPCLGVWNSLFYEFISLVEHSNVLLIGFKEFNNSALNLVKKGLEEKYDSNFYLLNLSFRELSIELEEKDPDSTLKSKLTEFKLGRFFDSNYENLKKFSDLIRRETKKQFQEGSKLEFDHCLFPPILGVDKNQEILDTLSLYLNSNCKELIALSPSLIANRLMNLYEEKLQKYNIKINKGKSLTSMETKKIKNQRFWNLHFEDRTGKEESILSRYVIFSNGSMFQAGMFETEREMKKKLGALMIDVPNKVDHTFQLTFNKRKEPTNLYVCGSALFNLWDQISDEIEIKHGTGLGLSIISSYRIGQVLLNR
ncbi:MAG: putative enzyme [Promethearchaeota archaeon]|nr:MAG: putative enzyme [Candidatus Lokiarchaeota archaeon]